jgi:hypothetical protein
MSENDQAREVRRIRRMLRGMAKLAKDASLTGSLQDGVAASVQQYNLLLGRLEQLRVTPPGMFAPLRENAGFDEVGVAAALLSAYIEEDECEAREGHGIGHGNVVIGLGGLRQLEELKDLGRIIRQNLPDWLREKVERTAEAEAEKATREAMREAAREAEKATVAGMREGEREAEKATAGAMQEVGGWAGPNREGRAARLTEVESRTAEVGAKLQAVAEQLRRDELSFEQRAELAEQLSRLGQEQARLAREHARLREGVL